MQASNKPIGKYHMKMLELLLSDPQVNNAVVCMDGKKCTTFTIRDDGTALFGVFKWGWINRLFNTYYQTDFLTVVQRIAYVLTNNGNTEDDMMEIIKESIDKVIKKDEKEKVIELLLHYAMLLSENSVLKLRYNYKEDKPSSAKEGNKIRRIRGMGKCGLNLGGECIPLDIEVTID